MSSCPTVKWVSHFDKGLNKFICPTCESRQHSADALRVHYNRVHLGKRKSRAKPKVASAVYRARHTDTGAKGKTAERDVESDVWEGRLAPSASMGPPASVNGLPTTPPVGKILRMLAGYPPSPTAMVTGRQVEDVADDEEEEELGADTLLSVSLPEDAAPPANTDRRLVVFRNPLAELAESAARQVLAGGVPSETTASPIVIVGVEYNGDLNTSVSTEKMEPASRSKGDKGKERRRLETAETASTVPHAPVGRAVGVNAVFRTSKATDAAVTSKAGRVAKVEKALQALRKTRANKVTEVTKTVRKAPKADIGKVAEPADVTVAEEKAKSLRVAPATQDSERKSVVTLIDSAKKAEATLPKKGPPELMAEKARTTDATKEAIVPSVSIKAIVTSPTDQKFGGTTASKVIGKAKEAAIAMATAVARKVVTKEARAAGVARALKTATAPDETSLVKIGGASTAARHSGTTPNLDVTAVPRALTAARTARWAAEVGIATAATLAIGSAAVTALAAPAVPEDGSSTSVVVRTERELWHRVQRVVEWIDELAFGAQNPIQEGALLDSMRIELRQLCLRGRELHALLVIAKRCGLLNFQEDPIHSEWRHLVNIGIRASLHRMERQSRQEPRKILRGVETDCEGLAFRDQEVKFITFGCLQMAPANLPVVFTRRRPHPRNNDSDTSGDWLSPKRVARQSLTSAAGAVTSSPAVVEEV